MIRRIIHINQEKCNGCGACAAACHEGAIHMVNGKAALMRDDYCDGLGDCLPACPAGAITFEEREAAAYDEAAVLQAKKAKSAPQGFTESQLTNWPVQIRLVPITSPVFSKANLLIAADCTAFTYGNFHSDFIRNHTCLIGCPKLDQTDYSEKLTQIFAGNEIESITVVRMEVPCCGGLEMAVKKALAASKKQLPWQVAVISTDGNILK